jgi:hypothetical protein
VALHPRPPPSCPIMSNYSEWATLLIVTSSAELKAAADTALLRLFTRRTNECMDRMFRHEIAYNMLKIHQLQFSNVCLIWTRTTHIGRSLSQLIAGSCGITYQLELCAKIWMIFLKYSLMWQQHSNLHNDSFLVVFLIPSYGLAYIQLFSYSVIRFSLCSSQFLVWLPGELNRLMVQIDLYDRCFVGWQPFNA